MIQVIILSVVLLLTIVLVINEVRSQRNRDYNEEMFHLLSEKVDILIKKLK